MDEGGRNSCRRSTKLRTVLKSVLVAAAVLGLGQAIPAQTAAEPSALTLQQAVRIALEKNPLRKAAIADRRVAWADVREARSVLLPRLTFSETATRGNDPVYVFGSELRQQRFTTADFTLNKLNTPLPIGNFSTRFGGTLESLRFVCQLARHESGKKDERGCRTPVGPHRPGDRIPSRRCLLRRFCWRRSNWRSPSRR